MSDDTDDVDPHDWFSDKLNPLPGPKKPAEKPAWPPTESPAPPPASGFSWGLTPTTSAAGAVPGSSQGTPPGEPPTEPPAVPPAVPPVGPPAEPFTPSVVPPAHPAVTPPPIEPRPAPSTFPPLAPPPLPPAESVEPTPFASTMSPFDSPAPSAVVPPAGPTVSPPAAADAESLDTVAMDSALEGAPHSHGGPPTVALPWETTLPELSASEAATELLGTGNPAEAGGSGIDALFGHDQFKEYEDEPLISLPFTAPRSAVEPPPLVEPPSRAEPPTLVESSPTAATSAFAGSFVGAGAPAAVPVAGQVAATDIPVSATAAAPVAAPTRPRRGAGEPISRNQRILLWSAGGVVVVLALVVLFLIGTRLPDLAGPASVVAVSGSPTPAATPTPTPVAAGPAAVGEHKWDQLRGGECLDPFTSPWAERFTVVDCAAPHPAQLVLRGTFPANAAAPSSSATPTPKPTGGVASGYPGIAALQSQINLLCTAPGVINLAVAGAFSDIQFQASYAATAAEWARGQHDYFCFVNRSSGEPLTGSLAAPTG